jgi:hypothetical protein
MRDCEKLPVIFAIITLLKFAVTMQKTPVMCNHFINLKYRLITPKKIVLGDYAVNVWVSSFQGTINIFDERLVFVVKLRRPFLAWFYTD